VEQHAILVLIFHADWCVPCVQVEQSLAQVEPRFYDRPVLFVELDLTHEADWEKAKYMAAALGVMEIFDAQKGELGTALLIDANSKKVLNYLDVTHGSKEMASRIDAALNQALTSK
jgi:thiol-disulfide isomerase/thioredoxin